MEIITRKSNDNPSVVLELQTCVKLVSETTQVIGQILNDMNADERLSLADLLGSDSFRFNSFIKFIHQLGLDIMKWGKEKMDAKNEFTKLLIEKIIDGIFYIKYFYGKFEYLISQKFWYANLTQIALGLLLIGGSLASMIYLGGGDCYLIAIDIAAGGTGISLFGQGLLNISNGIKNKSNIAHLKDDIKHILDHLTILKSHVVVAEFNVHDGDHASAVVSGKAIVRETANVPHLYGKKSWWDWITGTKILLQDVKTL